MAFAVEQASWSAPERQTERHLRLVGGTAVKERVEVVSPLLTEAPKPVEAVQSTAVRSIVRVEEDPLTETTTYSNGEVRVKYFDGFSDEPTEIETARYEGDTLVASTVVNYAANTHEMTIMQPAAKGGPVTFTDVYEGAAGWTQ